MNATERARRSDALYQSRGSKRGLCDTIALLEDDNAKLKTLANALYFCGNYDCRTTCPLAHLTTDYEYGCKAAMRELGLRITNGNTAS